MSDIYLKQKMLQICIIARDCYRLNENWAKLLGKKMAGLSRYEGETITLDTEYHGRMVSGLGMETNTFDLAGGDKSIQFEILGALNGPSEWYDFMVQREQGIHHIAFAFTEDQFEKGLDDLKRNTGMDRVQFGHPYATPEASYAYLATKEPVGTTVEILGFGSMGEAAARYREISAQMSALDSAGAPLAAMVPSDVTLIVDDIDRSLAVFAPLFHAPVPDVQDQALVCRYDGAEQNVKIRTAQMDMESTFLRFLEPVSGQTGWEEYAQEWGTGLYSIAYDVADLPAKQEQLLPYGMTVMQTGCYSDGTEYVLLDARQDYGAILELRTSEAIRRRLAQQQRGAGVSCHSEFCVNEKTPVREIVESETCGVVWEHFFPGSLENLKGAMAIAYRMPLGMVLKMSGTDLPEEKAVELFKALSEAKEKEA